MMPRVARCQCKRGKGAGMQTDCFAEHETDCDRFSRRFPRIGDDDGFLHDGERCNTIADLVSSLVHLHDNGRRTRSQK